VGAFFRALWAPSVSSDLALQRDSAAYWAAYGGLRALWNSPYLWAAVAATVVLQPLWCGEKWTPVAQDILPALLGFSVAAVAIILAAPGMKTFTILAAEGHAESYFIDLAARLVHFIIVQVVGLCALLAALAYPNAYTNFAGFFLLMYAMFSALSAAMAMFGIARLLNAAARPAHGRKSPKVEK